MSTALVQTDKAVNFQVNESKQEQTMDMWLTVNTMEMWFTLKVSNIFTFTSAVKEGKISSIIISLSYTKSMTELHPMHYCLITTDGMKITVQ